MAMAFAWQLKQTMQHLHLRPTNSSNNGGLKQTNNKYGATLVHHGIDMKIICVDHLCGFMRSHLKLTETTQKCKTFEMIFVSSLNRCRWLSLNFELL